jgi:hypothetical protein
MNRLRVLTLILVSAVAFASLASAEAPALPQIRHDGDAFRLIVNGKPFLILGGEVGNSATSTAPALAQIWPAVQKLHVNTLLTPVYWELIEPTEGQFDFSSVDRLIAGARANNLHLIFLWFGAWKNSMSTYMPAWVKQDSARFPHARSSHDQPVEILSPLGKETLAADVAAYGALMKHLRETDADAQTVLMVQIENEIGFIGDAREHDALADAAWGQAVPEALVARLRQRDGVEPELLALWDKHGARTSGTWAELFGDEPAGEEVFMAWNYARFIEALAARGKAEYALPTFVNCALNRPGWRPGQYPSAGPLPHLIDVWKAAAPSLDMLCPDVYFFDFPKWTARYRRPDNALFIPETFRSARGPANAMMAIAGQQAIGFSPFAIDDISGADADRLSETYSALRQLTPLLTGQTASVAVQPLSPKVNYDGTMDGTPQVVTVGPYRLSVAFEGAASATTSQRSIGGDPSIRGSALPRTGGMICFTAPDSYTVVGTGLDITHTASDGQDAVGLLEVEQWRPDDAGVWSPYRRLNGDQTGQGRSVRLDGGRIEMLTVKLYRFH